MKLPREGLSAARRNSPSRFAARGPKVPPALLAPGHAAAALPASTAAAAVRDAPPTAEPEVGPMTRRRALYAKPGAAAASGVLAPAQAQQQQQQQQGAAAGAPGAPPLASEASLASLRAVPRTLLGREESDVSGQVKRQWEWHATGLNMACVGAVAGWFSAGGVAACRHLGTPARQLLPSTVGGEGGIARLQAQA
jgi:hypothetical protein